ncbi:ATP-binding protein [Pedobacter sp. SYSU D00535]|uniref:PAS domain-containing sensor histidine kinase n=1 Tax=Pedobacter sp. SYSU D00535 TaxID=2810308 RepID=UPI001A95B386|nr:ATP-binding protein [Pedobacter sp. SYSU D00535]
MDNTYSKLEEENERLRKENEALIAAHKDTLSRLQKRLTVEEDLKESQERFVTVFNESKVANKIINLDLKMIQLNEALGDLLGYSREELLETCILEYTHPDFIKYWYDLHEALWKRELPSFQLEACLIRKDKREVWCLVNTIRFKDKGETFGYTSLVDITGRKQLERHKDEFISTISHELKTPLTSIKSYSQLLLRYFQKLEDEKPRLMLSKMDAKVNSLTTLIKDLVMASKIDSGKLTPRSDEYMLDSLLTEIVEEFKDTVTTRRIVLETEKGLKTKGDKFKIAQVIENLLTNAIKFSGEGTEVEVKLTKMENEGIVCIKDRGRGIAESSLTNIFERFYKVKEAESNQESGMGLGLYICKEIVKNQQGRLWVDSEVGKGSTFCFALPLLA